MPRVSLRCCCFIALLLVIGSTSSADDSPPPVHQFADGPPSFDLREYLPTPRKQTKNNCVAWAIAYGSLSCQVCQERQTTQPTRSCDLFSPSFIYNELAKHGDDGLHLNDAINYVNEHGCATLQTMPLGSREPDAAATSEAKIYKPWGHKKTTSVAEIRRYIQDGFPVILVVRNDAVFNCKEALAEPFRWKKTRAEMTADFDKFGPHAVCAVGYDDAKQAVLVMNTPPGLSRS